MLQTRLYTIQIASEKKQNLEIEINNIYKNIKDRFKNFGKFQDVLIYSSIFHSVDLKDEQLPEEFTKRNIIEPLVSLLGYEIIPETRLSAPSGKKQPDYIMKPKNEGKPIFYVEAEHLNADLYGKNIGVSQVNEWLLSRASKTDYGIATDGFLWILLKFDTTSAESKEILKVDLRQLFLKILNPRGFFSDIEINKIKEYFLTLDSEYISSFLEGYIEILEKVKEDISLRFYKDYVKYIFGYDEDGNVMPVSLVSNIITPKNISKKDKNLFSVIFMNRIIFIKFLEEKGIVPKNTLIDLLKKYESSGAPSTFYEAYLKPLFYEVFNKSNDSRTSYLKNDPFYIQIPYLNGGLFREIIDNEKNYNIENEGVELIIKNLLESYSFGLDSGINPDILGYIFEKTINFISGTGTNQQKMKGAYYTPDDVVEFIIEETLIPVIFNKMIKGLQNSGWSDTDLIGYNSVEDILDPENIPKNPIHINNMIESIKTIKVLDPACGSGHFLTAALSHILRIQEHLHRIIEKDHERYKLKRNIISNNLFGVDIDENAVEITRLRLWLSIIDEIENLEHIDTLPNIDFNIFVGNSLIGWFDEKLEKHPLINLLEDQYIQGSLDSLSVFYGNIIDEIRILLEKINLKDTIKAYRKLVGIYSLEEGERAVKVRDVLEEIRKRLYKVITTSYMDFLFENSKISKRKLNLIGKNITIRVPFHWKIDFDNVFEEGGFDVVIGNPPYIENRNYDKIDLELIKSFLIRKEGRKKIPIKPLFYHSYDCGNTHAYFIERSIKLLKKDGCFGFIVPLSLVSTDRMSSIRNFIHNNSAIVYYYNFDDRPGKIFSGLEHCRATIVVTEKGKELRQIVTSKYHRWYTKDRLKLFNNLKTVELNIEEIGNLIPKIGSKIEKDIFYKINQKTKNKFLNDYLNGDGIKTYYYNAPQYWIHAHTEEYVPFTEYYESHHKDEYTGEKIPKILKEKKISSHYKVLTSDLENSYVINGLINSSLFYWWFIMWSDGRDLLAQHVKSFPINLDDFPDELKEKLKSLVDELMKNFDENSNIKINRRSGGYVIKIKEIIPKKSKDIIDLIDDIFAYYFEFNDEEINFIKQFDIDFRI